MKYSTINGIVLKSINFRDSDKIFSILTKESGKVSVLARGVRKISSRRSGNLDTLNLIVAKISESRKGFDEIEEVKTVNSFINIKKSYELSLASYYLAELVYRTLEAGVDSEEILYLLLYCLKKLSVNSISKEEIISFFEIRFMKILGYDLNTDTCAKCGNEIPGDLKKYILDVNKGGFLCGNCFGLGKEITEDVFRWIREAKKLDLEKVKSLNSTEELRAATRSFISAHLDSKFKSLELF